MNKKELLRDMRNHEKNMVRCGWSRREIFDELERFGLDWCVSGWEYLRDKR